MVFVDGATSELMELRFCEAESTFSYFAAMRSYHGGRRLRLSDRRMETLAIDGGLAHGERGREKRTIAQPRSGAVAPEHPFDSWNAGDPDFFAGTRIEASVPIS